MRQVCRIAAPSANGDGQGAGAFTPRVPHLSWLIPKNPELPSPWGPRALGGAAGLGGDVVTSPPLLLQSASKRRSAALELRGILVSSSVPKRGGGRGGAPFMG